MILLADKGGALELHNSVTVVLNTADYQDKMKALLEDRTTHEKLKKDPTRSTSQS